MPFDTDKKPADLGDLNVVEVLRLADVIEKSPTYDQGDYVNWCGSPACIAGHCMTHEQALLWHENKTDDPDYIDPDEAGEQLLWLTYRQSNELFQATPYGCGAPPSNAEAAQVLRHLAVTGKVDWDLARETVAKRNEGGKD